MCSKLSSGGRPTRDHRLLSADQSVKMFSQDDELIYRFPSQKKEKMTLWVCRRDEEVYALRKGRRWRYDFKIGFLYCISVCWAWCDSVMSTSSRKKVRILHKLEIFVDSILNKQKSIYNEKSSIPFICPVFGSYSAERASSTPFDLWTLCTRDSDDVVFWGILQ